MLLMKKSFAVAFFQFYTYLERLDLPTSFFIQKKVWQNIKNERGGSRKTNESRSKDSEIFELPHSPFVLEPDYADIAKRLRLMSQPLNF